jgi:SAM-dependent methyltransferase
VADREARRLSFGSVADDYDRYRPAPPPEALDWLVPPGARAVLDLAAGTGLVTRGLIGRAERVVAVEPDARMRAVLAARCPQAEVLDGRGEDIPLPDASVDAVVISAAWHWLDPARAVPEITRVLRTGGTLGVMWTSRDDRVPWDRVDVPMICRCLRSTRLAG